MVTNWTLKAAFFNITILLIIPLLLLLWRRKYSYLDVFIIKPYFHNKSIEKSGSLLIDKMRAQWTEH